MTGAVGVKPAAAVSPKVLSVSNQADVLAFNVDLGPKPKGMPSSSILIEESKDERQDVEMSNAQEAVSDQIEMLIDDNGLAKKPTKPRKSADSAAASKRRPPGSYYRNLKKDRDSQQFAEASRGVSQSSVD